MNPLNNLCSDDLFISTAAIATADALFAVLETQRDVLRLRISIGDSVVTSPDISSFVEGLLKSFKRGVHFPHDLTLAALAASLSTVPTDFAHEYLEKLSNVRIQEMPMAPRIAAIALHKNISRYGQQIIRTIKLAEAQVTQDGLTREWTRLSVENLPVTNDWPEAA